MLTATVKIEFDAAKRLLEFKGKCNFLHGYHHVIEAAFTSDKRGKSGEVVDFYKLKEVLGKWVEENWDHNTLLSKKDKKLGDAISKITGQQIFYFEGDPSAENMAEYLINRVCPKLFGKHTRCISIRLYDNTHAWVEAKGGI